MNILERLKSEILVIDGAMGTLLIDKGVGAGECFELLNLKDPDTIYSIHKGYVEAGADVIETNTFGGNRIKLKEYGLEDKLEEINSEGVKLAKRAAGDKVLVAASIGPLGKFVEPMGNVFFDEAYEAFKEIAIIYERAGADIIQVETMNDIQELRIAVLAAKENTKLPVVASLTFEDEGRTISGTDPETAALILESVGADIIATNCSYGPQGLIPIIKKLAKFTSKPLLVMPNAGTPEVIEGKAVYKMTPEEFSKYSKKFVELGVNIVGGCCGTTPEHIKAVCGAVKGIKPKERKVKKETKLASRSRVIIIKAGEPLIIGERINPTKKKLLTEEIKKGKTHVIMKEAQSQEKAGAQVIDVNVSVADTDTSQAMSKAVKAVQNAVDIPVSIDHPGAKIQESGLKSFVGKALINSVSGKEGSLKSILPLAKRFGAALIGLALDDKGLPESSEEKISIAKKIISEAEKIGIPKEDIFIDTLVMTAGLGTKAPLETLEAAKAVKEKFNVKVSLGISNVSHGLPERSRLNSIYLLLALLHGVDAIIVDPTDLLIKNTLKSFKKIKNKKKAIEEYTDKFIKEAEKWKSIKIKPSKRKEEKKKKVKVSFRSLSDAVIFGDKEEVSDLVKELLKSKAPDQVIEKGLIPGIEEVGKRFSSGEYFLPQVISSAEAMKAGFELVKKEYKGKKVKKQGTIVIATVQGDIHDIGKNIVSMMLENYGFEVIDLGKDIESQKVINAARENNADMIFLSALLTTTMLKMEEVKQKLKEQGLDIPVVVGGAPVTSNFAKRIGASYGTDAIVGVQIARDIIKMMKRF